MLNVEGKAVLSELAEVVKPLRTALLVVDMQNDLVDERGWLSRTTGTRIPPSLAANVQRLIGAARRSGAKVIYAVTAIPQGRGWAGFPVSLARAWARDGSMAGDAPLTAGSWGAGIIEGLTPEADETRLQRAKLSAFHGTSLDSILQAAQVQTVVVAGVASHLSIDSTGRDASFLGYYVVIPVDGVASHSPELQDAALRIMNTRFDCVSVQEIIDLWERSGA